MAPIYALHDSGDYAGTVDAFLTMAIGPGYRPSLDETLSPDWFAQSVADLDTLFLVEGPAYREWQFTEELARSISQPAFVVVGAESPQVRAEDHALLQKWLPQADAFVLAGASHALQMQNPRGMADALVAFLSRHPMAAGVPA